MKQKFILFLAIGILTLTGCNDSPLNDLPGLNNFQENKSETKSIDEKQDNNSSSSFSDAIKKFKNAQSVSISYEKKSQDTTSSYATITKYDIIIDYENKIIKETRTYSKNNFGESTKKETTYVDLDLRREYFSGKDNGYSCNKWWYERYGDDEFSQFYNVLEKVKSFTDDDVVKIVSTNYRVDFNDSKYGIGDIGIDDGQIKYLIYSYDNKNISNSVEINFNSYNSDTLSLPNAVKNALSEREFVRVCDE